MSVAPTELLGRWALERHVRDRVSGIRGRVAGTLDLSLDGEGVRWVERGVFAWEKGRMAMTRELRLVPEGGGWLVTFDDGRPFHPWRPGEPVFHDCGADRYDGLIALDDDAREMWVLWDVTGPEKAQRLVTRCRSTTPH